MNMQRIRPGSAYSTTPSLKWLNGGLLKEAIDAVIDFIDAVHFEIMFLNILRPRRAIVTTGPQKRVIPAERPGLRPWRRRLAIQREGNVAAPILFDFAPHSRRFRVLTFEPMRRPTGAVGRTLALRHDAFKAELAGALEHERAVLLDMLVELDARVGACQQLGHCGCARPSHRSRCAISVATVCVIL